MDVDTGQNIFVCTLSISFPWSDPVITAFFPKAFVMFFLYVQSYHLIEKAFSPFFMDRIQLLQGYRATARRPFAFNK